MVVEIPTLGRFRTRYFLRDKMTNRLAYKILAVDKSGAMMSPISFSGLAVSYEMGGWAKPKNSTRYLFVYNTLHDAQKVFALFSKEERKHLVIFECMTENFEKAIGAGPVAEYRCTRLKPTKVVE